MTTRKHTFKNWVQKRFDHNQLADLCNHGAVNGFSGLIYYSECCKLYKKFKDEIWDMLHDEAESMGISILEMISQFRKADGILTVDAFETLLVWFTAEKIAYDQTHGEYRN
jgi:hypothetical protein